MSAYRKKPVVIEASQWFRNGDHPDDCAKDRTGFEGGQITHFSGEHARANDWEGGVVRRYRHPNITGYKVCEHCRNIMNDHGWIDTLEGGHVVCPGDWIITGVKGERYPCKPDIFAATYEPAQSTTKNDTVEQASSGSLAPPSADPWTPIEEAPKEWTPVSR